MKTLCFLGTQDSFVKQLKLLSSRVLHLQGPTFDLYGRIALEKDTFSILSGYNERLRGWGVDDIDLLRRARALKCRIKSVNLDSSFGSAIKHSDEERVAYQQDKDLNKSNLTNDFISVAALKKGDYIVNAANWGTENTLQRFDAVNKRFLSLPIGV